MGEHYRNRSCPSCGSTVTDAQSCVRSLRSAEDLNPTELQPYWAGFFKEKRFFSFYRCSECGLLYAPRYLTDAQLAQLYSQMSDNTAGVNLEALRLTQHGYFEPLKSRPMQGGYLEMGPDIGLFTECAVREGQFDKYWLYEPNQAVHEALRSRLQGHAHEISTAFLDVSAVPEASLGAAVMIHVLDHIVDPKVFLQALRPKLRPDATLLVVTHDERSLLARLLGARWPAYCMQHPHLFNPHSMRTLLKNSGFETLEIVKSTNRFPVTYLAQHFLFAMGLGRWSLPKWEKLQLPLRLGNILTVARPA